MSHKVGRDSVEPWNLFGAMDIRARRSLALPREISSWSQCPLKMASRLAVNHPTCRQVLECGDRVREVTALAASSLKIAKRAAGTATPTQSGDSEDSVTAVQDARAPTRFALGSWSPCAVSEPWRLPMNLSVLPASCRQKRLWICRRDVGSTLLGAWSF